MIKKLICAFFGVILCFGFMLSLSADTALRIDEVGLSISLPDNAMVFTRDTPADDPNFAKIEWNKKGLDYMLESSNMYLDAFDIYISYEITMTYVELGFGDFNEMSDSNINSYIKGAIEALESADATVIKSSIYQHSQAKFAVIVSHQTPVFKKSSNAVSYITIFNGNIYTISIKDFLGDLSPEDEAFAKRIIDSVKFDGGTVSSKANTTSKTSSKTNSAPPKASSVAPTAAFTYTDDETKTTFTVPANWSKKALSKTRQYIDTKFVNNQNNEGIIMYGSTDFWATLSDTDKAGYSRTDFNNNLFTAADLAAAMKIDASQVTTVKYNDNTYYKVVMSVPVEMAGSNLTITMTLLMYLDNGYMYAFQFNGTDSSSFYADFETLMRSVKYGGSQTVSSVSSAKSNSAPNTPATTQANQSDGSSPFLAALIALAIFAAPILIYRYTVVHKPVESRKAMKITIFYGLGGAALTALLAALSDIGFVCVGAVVLWSFVNYLILTKGGSRKDQVLTEAKPQNEIPAWKLYGQSSDSFKINTKPTEKEQSITQKYESLQSQTEAFPAAPEMTISENGTAPKFCENCGNKLLPTSKFCPKCGSKIEKLENQG